MFRRLLVLTLGLLLTGGSAGAVIPRAGWHSSHNGQYLLHLKAGAYPAVLRLGESPAHKTLNLVEAINGQAVREGEDGFLFFARWSKISRKTGGSFLLCKLTAGDLACDPAALDPEGPLTQGMLWGQVLGVRVEEGGQTVVSLEIKDKRMVPRSPPLQVLSLAPAYGKVAVLHRPAGQAEPAISVLEGKEGIPVNFLCAGCKALLTLHRFEPWVLVVRDYPQPQAAMAGLPPLPGSSPPVLGLRLFSVRDGGQTPEISLSFPLLPPGPPGKFPLEAGMYDGFKVSALDAQQTAWRLCWGARGCRDILLNQTGLQGVGGPVYPGMAAAPISGGQWLGLPLPQGLSPGVEWFTLAGESLGSRSIGAGSLLSYGDAAACEAGDCSPFQLVETPLVWYPMNISGSWPALGKSAALGGGGPELLRWYEKGLVREQWSGPVPATRPLWIPEGLLVFSKDAATLFHHSDREVVWKKRAGFDLTGASFFYLGEQGFLVAKGAVLLRFTLPSPAWRQAARLKKGGVWLGQGKDGVWGMEPGGLVYFPAKKGAKLLRFTLEKTASCVSAVSEAAAAVVCEGLLQIVDLKEGRRRVALDQKAPGIPEALWFSGKKLWLLMPSADVLAKQEIWIVDRKHLQVQRRLPIPAVLSRVTQADGAWQESPGCLMIPKLKWCLGEDGRMLPVGDSSWARTAEDLFSRLGLFTPQLLSLAAGGDQGVWQRLFQFPDGKRWIWRSILEIKPAPPPPKAEWIEF